jgi:hypothetical protein
LCLFCFLPPTNFFIFTFLLFILFKKKNILISFCFHFPLDSFLFLPSISFYFLMKPPGNRIAVCLTQFISPISGSRPSQKRWPITICN